MYQTLLSQVSLLVMLVVCGLALAAGRAPERLAATALGAAWLLSMVLQDRSNLHGVQWALFAIDVALAFVSTGIALRWETWWLAVFAALAWLTALMHFVTAVDIRLLARAYLTAVSLTNYGMLATLVWAVAARTWRERKPPAT